MSKRRLTVKQSAIACGIVFCVMVFAESTALLCFEKNTAPFHILMGIVLICPFTFTAFLQGVWQETEKNQEEKKNVL